MNQANTQVALVTGGARRIGAAIVRALHDKGYRVVIHCHYGLDEAHALAQELNNKRMDTAIVLQRDLTEADAGMDLISEVNDWAGRLDVLVNNASIFKRSGDIAVWQDLFAINVQAPYFLSMAARTLLAKTKGVIVNITDIHAEKPLMGYEIYCQTKAALEMQTKALAKLFAPEIRVNAVAPGPNVWPEHENSLSSEDKERIIAKTLLKRFGSADYIAQAVLAMVGNDYVTGQVLKVDGGRGLV